MVRTNIEALTSLPHEVVLEMGGQFTITEIRNLAFLGFVNDYIPVRLIPAKLIQTLKDIYQGPENTLEFLYTLQAAYVLYRNSVNRESFTAPLVLKNEAYEWPEPVNLSWDSPNSLRFIGAALGAFEMTDKAVAITLLELGDEFYEKIVDIQTGQPSERQVAKLRAKTHEVVLYQIPKIADVAMLQNMAWQTFTLRRFALGLMRCSGDVQSGTFDPDKVASFIKYLLGMDEKTYQLPAIRFARSGEITQTPSHLMITDFAD